MIKNNNISIAFLSFLLFFFCFNALTLSQNFIIPDTVCVGEVVEIEYTKVAEEFCINYDINFLNYDVSVNPVPNYPKNQDPTFCHFVQDDSGNHYGFVTNFETNNLVRLDFGQSLQNTPVVVTIPIEVISKWMGFKS